MERLARYAAISDRLLAQDQAYYCYCTAAELDAERKRLEAAHLPPRYSGRCAHLSDAQRAAFEAEGRRPRDPLPDRARPGRLRRSRPRPRRDRCIGPRRRPRDRPGRRHAALSLLRRRRRRGDADQPRHPGRGSPEQHAQAHPPVPGPGRGGAPVRPPAAHPQPRPDQDEQAQEPDRGRRLHRTRASSARAWSTTSPCSAGRPAPRRRSSLSTRSRRASAWSTSRRAARSSTGNASNG